MCVIFNFVTSFGTVIAYSFTSLLNSGVIAPSAILKLLNVLSVDFFSSFVSVGFVELLVFGFFVVFPPFDELPFEFPPVFLFG